MRNENTYKRWKRIPISNTKATKTTMATFKVTTYYNNLKNDKFSVSFVYFPSNENGWKPKILGETLKFESQRLHNIKYVGTKM